MDLRQIKIMVIKVWIFLLYIVVCSSINGLEIIGSLEYSGSQQSLEKSCARFPVIYWKLMEIVIFSSKSLMIFGGRKGIVSYSAIQFPFHLRCRSQTGGSWG